MPRTLIWWTTSERFGVESGLFAARNRADERLALRGEAPRLIRFDCGCGDRGRVGLRIDIQAGEFVSLIE